MPRRRLPASARASASSSSWMTWVTVGSMLLVLTALLGARDQLAQGASAFFSEVAPSDGAPPTDPPVSAEGSSEADSQETSPTVGIQIIDVP